MGNCFIAKSTEKNPNFPSKPSRIQDEPSGLVVKIDTTKKKEIDEFKEEERIHVDEVKRGGDRENEPIYEKIQKTDKEKSPEDINFISNSLKNHFVFYNLNETEREQIVKAMFYCSVEAEEYIFKQGDSASSYFILEKGELEVIINDDRKKSLYKGEGFGELALLYSAPRSASIRAMEKCYLWAIDRITFRNVVADIITKEYSENRIFYADTMTNEQKDSIASVLITLKFKKDQNIVVEGDPASSLYIVKEGQVVVFKGDKEIRKMNKGDSFGEQALYYNTVRGATVRAGADDVKCLTLGRDTLTRILGDSIQVITFRNQQKWALEKSSLLNKLTKMQVEKILDAMKIVQYKAGNIVFRKGGNCSLKIIAVIDGSLKKVKSGTVVALKGTVYGDEFLTEGNKAKLFDEDIMMETDGTLSEIALSDFEKAIGGKIEDALKKNETSHEKKMVGLAAGANRDVKSIEFEDLIYYKKLGSGMFGSVYLVKDPALNQFFALKCVAKQQVVEQNLEKHLQQEKSVLEVLNFPFVMQFTRTFKDENYIYFLVEYIKGLELYDVIRIINLLNASETQFYVGSMILAIEFLHLQGIVYRDLKPENVMIDHTGYMKLIDMGTAKFMKNKGASINRTFTIIGTPHYMAPEIIAGKGYSFAVDLWSIGICMYEFMCGMVPFGEEAEDPYEIHDEIMNMSLKYPTFLKDNKAKRLIDQLLNKVAETRLGGSYAALKAHSWFDHFDWDKLLDKQLKPPLLPPKEKIISDEEIKKMEKAGKKVTAVIEEEAKNLKRYRKEQAPDPNWDKNF